MLDHIVTAFSVDDSEVRDKHIELVEGAVDGETDDVSVRVALVVTESTSTIDTTRLAIRNVTVSDVVMLSADSKTIPAVTATTNVGKSLNDLRGRGGYTVVDIGREDELSVGNIVRENEETRLVKDISNNVVSLAREGLDDASECLDEDNTEEAGVLEEIETILDEHGVQAEGVEVSTELVIEMVSGNSAIRCEARRAWWDWSWGKSASSAVSDGSLRWLLIAGSIDILVEVLFTHFLYALKNKEIIFLIVSDVKILNKLRISSVLS